MVPSWHLLPSGLPSGPPIKLFTEFRLSDPLSCIYVQFVNGTVKINLSLKLKQFLLLCSLLVFKIFEKLIHMIFS
jgi:hypothetical protein